MMQTDERYKVDDIKLKSKNCIMEVLMTRKRMVKSKFDDQPPFEVTTRLVFRDSFQNIGASSLDDLYSGTKLRKHTYEIISEQECKEFKQAVITACKDAGVAISNSDAAIGKCHFQARMKTDSQRRSYLRLSSSPTRYQLN